MELIPAAEADIPFLMATERLPGYDAFLGRWDEARHLAALADARFAYFIAWQGGERIGFTILRDWNTADRVTYIQRMALVSPGQGLGKDLLTQVVDAVFRETAAQRLWLHVFPDNPRARRAYEVAGFQTEGLARWQAFFGGVPRDQVTMAMIRPDWQALRGETPSAGVA